MSSAPSAARFGFAKRLAKDVVKNIPVLGPWVRRKYFAYVTRDDLTFRIQQALRSCPSALIVQIGANDGDGALGDPIAPLMAANPAWRGLFVEPVPYLFRRLKANYGDAPRFLFENAAIMDESSPRPFYCVAETARQQRPDLPQWCDHVGSFSREHLLRHWDGALAPFIVELSVSCLSFGDLLRKHAIERFDFLHIDAEGFDWKILRQVDLARCEPRVVLFEHLHLSPDEKAAALKFVRPRYLVHLTELDCLCIRKDIAAEGA